MSAPILNFNFLSVYISENLRFRKKITSIKAQKKRVTMIKRWIAFSLNEQKISTTFGMHLFHFWELKPELSVQTYENYVSSPSSYFFLKSYVFCEDRLGFLVKPDPQVGIVN